MTPSPLELMRSRIACHYLYAATEGDPRMLSVNQWHGGVAPRFYLGRTTAGSWDNLASRRVAERLGLRQIGVDFHVT